MVDAAIGGKTGVNLPKVKNYIGTIYQPDSIFIDPAVLDTLKLETFCEGVVEMIKHSLIRDEEMFGWLERNIDGILLKEEKVLEKGIWESCRIKLEIVLRDPREAGVRRLLNFGHTIGHALEGVSRYRITHGAAVALGCLVEGYLSGLMESELERMASLYIALKLPFASMLEEINFDELYQCMSRDKKGFRFVTLKKIGEAHSHEGSYCISFGKDQIFGALEWVRYRVGRSFPKPSALSQAVLDSDP
jgi:3-dehydroquinate synthase